MELNIIYQNKLSLMLDRHKLSQRSETQGIWGAEADGTG